MIAKAIDKICSLADPYMTQINGSTYSSKQLYRYDTDLRAKPIEVKTLTGMTDYIFANKEAFNGWKGYFLHVADEETVVLISELDNDRQDYLLNELRGCQVFITCCERSNKEQLNEGKIFYVENGRVEEITSHQSLTTNH